MKLLLVAATSIEIQPFVQYWQANNDLKNLQVEILITGVGMVATAFSMGRKLAISNFDLAVNAGIAGAFCKTISLGEVVTVKDDRFAELGAEDNDAFLSIDDLGFGKSKFSSTWSNAVIDSLRSVSSITVNKVHGNSVSIEKTTSLFDPQIESMEGAAFFYSCSQIGLPCIQVRGVSNYVEPRNRSGWQIPLAVERLNEVLIRLINHL